MIQSIWLLPVSEVCSLPGNDEFEEVSLYGCGTFVAKAGVFRKNGPAIYFEPTMHTHHHICSIEEMGWREVPDESQYGDFIVQGAWKVYDPDQKRYYYPGDNLFEGGGVATS